MWHSVCTVLLNNMWLMFLLSILYMKYKPLVPHSHHSWLYLSGQSYKGRKLVLFFILQTGIWTPRRKHFSVRLKNTTGLWPWTGLSTPDLDHETLVFNASNNNIVPATCIYTKQEKATWFIVVTKWNDERERRRGLRDITDKAKSTETSK